LPHPRRVLYKTRKRVSAASPLRYLEQLRRNRDYTDPITSNAQHHVHQNAAKWIRRYKKAKQPFSGGYTTTSTTTESGALSFYTVSSSQTLTQRPQVHDVLQQMRSTLGTLEVRPISVACALYILMALRLQTSLSNLGDHSQNVSKIQIVDPSVQLQSLEREMAEQDRRQGQKIDQVRGTFRDVSFRYQPTHLSFFALSRFNSESCRESSCGAGETPLCVELFCNGVVPEVMTSFT
jgi:hypothetical protein